MVIGSFFVSPSWYGVKLHRISPLWYGVKLRRSSPVTFQALKRKDDFILTYEQLLNAASENGLLVKEQPLIQHDGLIKGNRESRVIRA